MSQLNAKCVLVVDDSPDQLELISELLLDEYSVKTALSGEKAMRLALSENPPDIILLDVMMPDPDGYEVCRQLKARPQTAEIPVIFLTAKGEVEDETYGLELGAVDYIVKPVSPPIVRARVRNHLSMSANQAILRCQAEELRKQNLELLEAAQFREAVEEITHHDLKNPLHPIISCSSLLLAQDSLPPDDRECVKIIHEAGQKMLRLVNTSLDVFKMERNIYKLEPEKVDLLAILRELASEHAARLNRRNLSLEIRLDGESCPEQANFFVRGEELLCYSMLGNLLINAVEASPKGGAIKIELRKGDPAWIRIYNQGEVPDEIRPRFFEKFVTSGKSGGTGLGTYSAKLMALTQGGEIHLKTGTPGHTTIEVALPSR